MKLNLNSLVKLSLNLVLELKLKILLDLKVRKILSTVESRRTLDLKDLIAESARFCKKYRLPFDQKWVKMYALVSGTQDPKYISEKVYYLEIEKRLNNKTFSHTFSDKNLYDRMFPGYRFPNTFLRLVGGTFYSKDYKIIDKSTFDPFEFLQKLDSFVVKPATDSGGGKGVHIFKKYGNRFVDNMGVDFNIKYFEDGANYVFQELITHHQSLEIFNSRSVNTIRIFTYRSLTNDSVIVLHSLLRVGRGDSIVDNQASGGVTLSIDENGQLSDYALDKYGNKYTCINGAVIPKGYKIMKYSEILAACRAFATFFLYDRLLGFDVTLDESGEIIFIEVNNMNNEINFYQMHGKSLFGDFSYEIFEGCKYLPKRTNIDFSI